LKDIRPSVLAGFFDPLGRVRGCLPGGASSTKPGRPWKRFDLTALLRPSTVPLRSGLRGGSGCRGTPRLPKAWLTTVLRKSAPRSMRTV
jgi:hypothetical protein